MILYYLLILFFGFELLLKGSDLFVDGSIGLAKRLRIPDYIVGLTVVAMGTSMPETAVSLTAIIRGNSDICLGNIIGSNIINTLIILGISALIMPLSVSKGTLLSSVPFMIICSLLLYIFGLDNKLTLREGSFFLFLFAFYVIVLIGSSGNASPSESSVIPVKLTWIILFLVIGLAAIIIGSKITIYGATELARLFNISERLISLTIVAFGTSLPELFTSVNADRKGNSDISIGNIIGSNIYNILFILGSSSLFSEIAFEPGYVTDSLVNLAAGLLLYLLCIKHNRLSKMGGLVLILGYSIYFLFIMVSGVFW